MDIHSAKKLIEEYENKSVPSKEDEFIAMEALKYLIDQTKDPSYMMYLGGIHYENKDFNLAEKYYLMAAEYDYSPAFSGLGYIYYYGRTGERDYEKAFFYYQKAAERGDLQCAYKLADMYKNGYFVEKDFAKYAEIIETLWEKVKTEKSVFSLVPEVATRLAGIRKKQDRTMEAVELYFLAKDYLGSRIRYYGFFGNFTIMKLLEEELYSLIELDEEFLDFWDLYVILNKPCLVSFRYKNEEHIAECFEEKGEPVYRFDGQYYRTIDDLMQKSVIGEKKAFAIAAEFYDFEIKK